MTNDEVLLSRLNKIDVCQDTMAGHVSEIKTYIAVSAEREKHTAESLLRVTTRLDEHDRDLRDLRDNMNQNKPMLTGVRGWIASTIALLTAAFLAFFIKDSQ